MRAPPQCDLFLKFLKCLKDFRHFFQHIFTALQQCRYTIVVQYNLFSASIWFQYVFHPRLRNRCFGFLFSDDFIKFRRSESQKFFFEQFFICMFYGKTILSCIFSIFLYINLPDCFRFQYYLIG